MPEFKINYDIFKQDVYYSIGICGVMFILSIFTAACKKPFFSFLYITVGCVGTLFVLLASLKCYDYNRLMDIHETQICNNSTRPKEIQDELEALIYPYMCTTECKCYSGSGGSTMDLWKSYNSSLIEPFNRNNLDRTTRDAGNNEIFPLAWTSDASIAVNTFRDCYERVLLP